MKQLSILLLAFSLSHLYASAEVETYKIDTAHSSIKFGIRHFVAKTTGKFNQFEGTLTIDRDNWSESSVKAAISVPSVDTANEKRDSHLQEDDYFNTEKYPLMIFESTKWELSGGKDKFKVTGNLTMMDVTKKVVLDVDLLGFGDGMKGAYLSGWEAKTVLDRTEWGVSGGQPAVGAEVEVTINIEAIRQ